MKNSIAIIAEYNPFHNGHLLHLNKARQLACENLPAIAIMSGSFMQRGEPAFADKWLRAQAAVLSGADLVLELPAVFSCRSAEFFAVGAVRLLAASGVVKYLAFGAETADIQTLSQAAAIIDSRREELRTIIKSGTSYAAARTRILESAGTGFAANKANDILALEYCRALHKYAPDITPLVIRREGAGYNDTGIESSFASAGGIRAEYAANGLSAKILQQLPQSTHELIKKAHADGRLGYDAAALTTLINYRLQMLTETQIAAACECSEGLEHRLKKAAGLTDLNSVLDASSSKRYARARIRRLLMQLLLDTQKSFFTQAQPQYLRVLAFNSRGKKLLAQMRKTSSLPVITKLGRNFKNCLTGETTRDMQIISQLQIDVNAANIMELVRINHRGVYNSDFLNPPIYIPD